MPVPKFSDLNKAARDLFADDFEAGRVKLTLKSTSSSGVALRVEGSKATDSNAVTAELESKFTTASGFTIKETWNTKSEVGTEVSAKDKAFKGSNVAAAATFTPSKGFKSFKVKGDYATDQLTIDTVFDGKNLTTGGVFQYNHFLLGVSTVVDATRTALGSYSIGAGYTSGDIVVNSTIKNGTEVEGSVYHTPRANLKAGVNFNFARGADDATGLDVAIAYAADKDTTIKAKINNKLELNLAYRQTVRSGITLTLSALVDASNLNSDKHKLGLGFSLEN